MSQRASNSLDLVALNADVVGYSRLLADDFATTAKEMGEIHNLVERRVEESGGTLVNFVGDNFMAAFEDAKYAIQSAISISKDIEDRNVRVADSQRLRFRMGLDQGPVSVEGDQYFGDALNVAARIQAMAPAGGISISGRVFRALDEPALRFKSLGRQSLKNIPEETEVFQFVDLPTDGRGQVEFGKVTLARPTLAVLPIHADSLEPSLQAMAGVIRDDLIHSLSQVPRLQVVNASDSPEPGSAQAPARYLLETGVHQIGDQVRVYAKLMDVTTMNIVTTSKWTAPAAELLDLSDEVSRAVARSVTIELIIGEPAGLYNELDDPEGIQDIYTGWYHLTSESPEGFENAIEYFGKVATRRPDVPYGHVLRGFTYWMLAASVPAERRSGYLEKALENAQVGIELGDPTGLAQMVIAAVMMFQGNNEEALDRLDKLEIRRPTCDLTYAVEGSVRRYMGEWEKSVDLLDRAQRLTAANNPWYPTVQACSLYLGGRVEQAAATAEAVIEFQPSNLEALLVLTAAQVEMGLDRRARATADLIRERFPSVDVARWIEESPYQKREMVDRWKGDLMSAGVIDPET